MMEFLLQLIFTKIVIKKTCGNNDNVSENDNINDNDSVNDNVNDTQQQRY